MRQIIFFLFILFCSCRPSLINAVGESTDISTTLTALPSNPSIESSRIVLQAFFDSYNRYVLNGVLATLAETFAYGDCDFAERQILVFETKEDLTVWLQAKFVEGERFREDEIIIAPAEGSPANDSRSTAVQ